MFCLSFGQISSVAFFIFLPLMVLLKSKIGLKARTILLGISTLILIVAFIGLKIHANSGGIYETKTIGAMIFRIAVTLVFAIIAFFTINKQLNKNHNE
jgi:hypothetical protein